MTLGPGINRTPLPDGFFASGVNCGVRRYRPDIGMIYSEIPAVAAAVYTLNQMAAAPIEYCRKLTPSAKIRAILTNSGQANAATGPEGVENNLSMVKALAEVIQCEPEQILVASTGVIGPQLDMGKILPAMPTLKDRLTDTAETFSLAILTTDLVPKTISTVVELANGPVRITGIAKGSGMIHPNMATMLGYILTDADLTPEQADRWLKSCVNDSFNMISVDGDTSTNDCVFLLANGMTQIPVTTEEDEAKFKKALNQLAILLAQSIAMDGEGAGKLIEVRIRNSPDLEMARRAARSITISPLIKTAVHGEDPNWGRIVARIGAEQVPSAIIQQMTLTLQGTLLFENGRPTQFDRSKVRELLRKTKVEVDVDFKGGAYSATAWGCDLSKKYVEINTEYPT